MINPNQTKTVFWLIISLVILAAAGTGIYFWYKKHKATDPETPIEEIPTDTSENPEDVE